MVSEDDVQAGRFTVFDVVLPLPGSRIVYPSNDTKQVAPRPVTCTVHNLLVLVDRQAVSAPQSGLCRQHGRSRLATRHATLRRCTSAGQRRRAFPWTRRPHMA